MQFPAMSDAVRLERLQPQQGRVRIVLDTDTFNEIDDQFAVVHALLSPEQLDVEAIYAAPFFNHNASSAADGMEKSYEEILRLLERLDVSPQGLVHRGSTEFLSGLDDPQDNEAVRDLIERAMASDGEPLYVAAIGAITNVASAIILQPEIIERIVVIWLGGHALNWPHTKEFNLKQDLPSAKLVLDCGVPLVLLPCLGVTSHLLTSGPEVDEHVAPRGAIGQFLAAIFHDHQAQHSALSKVIWDLAATAYLIDHTWVPTQIMHSPVLTDQVTWSTDPTRHLVRVASYVDRDAIFHDLFEKLKRFSG